MATAVRGRAPTDALARIMARVDFSAPVPDRAPHLGSCWVIETDAEYSAMRVGSNYGGTRRMVKTHRFVYEELFGPVGSLEIDHLCMVKHCVNPSHLEAVTKKENLRRADVAFGIRSAATHCPSGHEYTPENIYINPTSKGRMCRSCNRLRRRGGVPSPQ